MPSLERRDVRKSLKKKGFAVTSGAKHDIFTFEPEGKLTGVSTYMSRGTSYKTLGDDLVSDMADQIELSTYQFVDLVNCPMSQSKYERISVQKGVLDSPTIPESEESEVELDSDDKEAILNQLEAIMQQDGFDYRASEMYGKITNDSLSHEDMTVLEDLGVDW